MIKKCQKTKKPSKLATSLEHQDVSVNSWVLKKNWVCQCLCVGLPYYMVRAGPQFSGPCILPNESTSDSCRPSYYKELDTVFNVETNCQQVTAFSFMLLLCFNNKIIQAAKEIWWRPHRTLYPPQWGGGSWPPSNTMCLPSPRVFIPNSMLIHQPFFQDAGTRDRQTHHTTRSSVAIVCIFRIRHGLIKTSEMMTGVSTDDYHYPSVNIHMHTSMPANTQIINK